MLKKNEPLHQYLGNNTADWAFYVQSTLLSLPKVDKPEQTAFKRNRSIVSNFSDVEKTSDSLKTYIYYYVHGSNIRKKGNNSFPIFLRSTINLKYVNI